MQAYTTHTSTHTLTCTNRACCPPSYLPTALPTLPHTVPWPYICIGVLSLIATLTFEHKGDRLPDTLLPETVLAILYSAFSVLNNVARIKLDTLQVGNGYGYTTLSITSYYTNADLQFRN